MAREVDFGGWLGNWTLGNGYGSGLWGMTRELDFGEWLWNWSLGDG